MKAIALILAVLSSLSFLHAQEDLEDEFEHYFSELQCKGLRDAKRTMEEKMLQQIIDGASLKPFLLARKKNLAYLSLRIFDQTASFAALRLCRAGKPLSVAKDFPRNINAAPFFDLIILERKKIGSIEQLALFFCKMDCSAEKPHLAKFYFDTQGDTPILLAENIFPLSEINFGDELPKIKAKRGQQMARELKKKDEFLSAIFKSSQFVELVRKSQDLGKTNLRLIDDEGQFLAIGKRAKQENFTIMDTIPLDANIRTDHLDIFIRKALGPKKLIRIELFFYENSCLQGHRLSNPYIYNFYFKKLGAKLKVVAVEQGSAS
ncbi:hypothetical protein PPO43_15870 [Saprospira sp. CCB-QB6]|uniref:hypothetical protein n=1 Tax=Saprospira sp. CCB-QB6 TaxID=3023936 RepID=UPI0023497D8F|nr:hypothetical protein [Saprospira sp. CCB-QB6]WCL81451.1 hypothetical protein PPO43_15870 [Saprospira sp. CCB-QB6]